MSTCRNAYSVSPATAERRSRWTNSLRSSACSSSSACHRVDASSASTAPSQNTLPRTAASWSSRFSSAASASSRAAMIPCTVSGSLRHVAAVEQNARVLLGVQRVAARARQQRRLRLRPSRAARAGRDELGGLAVRERREREREGVRLPATPARAAARAAPGRAVPSTSSGTPLDRSTRSSTKSSRASSAQCRSSKTRTSGRSLGERLEEPAPGGERLVLARPGLLGQPGQRTQLALEPLRL